jgi:quinol monooxygenase YgiN
MAINVSSRLQIIVGMIAGVSLAYALFLRGEARTRLPSTKQAFLLSVVMKFKSIEAKEHFQVLFQPYSEYVRLNEPQTLSYVLYESDKEATQVMIFERYMNKEAYLNIHRVSKEFLSFREKLQSMVSESLVELNGHSYIESSLGYV